MFEPMEARIPQESSVDRWVDRFLLSSGRWNTVVVATGLAAGLVASYAITYSLGGTQAFAATFFLLAVMVAAARFGYWGAALTAVAAAELAGPLMPLDVRAGTPQVPSMWISRAVMLLMVGIATTALVERVKVGHGRELALAQKERDLAIGKAAVVTTVAHEFRSPLTVINGVARMLENEHVIPEEFRPLFRGLMDSTDRLIDLVTTMSTVLDGSGGAVFLRTEPLVTREILGTVLGRVAGRGAHSRVQIDIEPDAEFVQTDRELLEQLLRHVVENAVKFSAADQTVQVHAFRAGDHVRFDVSDRGAGIDPSLLSRDPFTQGDQSITREQDGLGLGLFAAARLAEMLGGSLVFNRRRGGGTVVRITIAASAPTPLAP